MLDELANEPAIAEITPEVVETPEVAESAPAVPETDAVPKPDKVQERFDKLTREKYDALRAADSVRYENERLSERLKALETKPDPVVPDTLPTLEQYEFDEAKYRTALAAYYRTEARNEVKSALQQEREQLKKAERLGTFAKRQSEFAALKPDYIDKVQRNDSLPITNDMREAIIESDVGPQVAYYLAENPDTAAAISQLSPLSQAREIGRIEARIEAAKARPAPVVSKAPPPPPSIGAVEPSLKVSTTSPESDALSDDEWFRAERKRTSRRK